jgi:hypothetical protein
MEGDDEEMAGAYVEKVEPFSTTTIALPPPNRAGIVDYGRVFVSLATDFGPATVRLANGRPGNFTVEELQVTTGRDVVREVNPNHAAQVVSVIHRAGPPVSALVEFETRPDF